MKISDRIFELIKEKGMTQREFSERTGIPQSTISDWKGKNLNPSADKLLIISQVLNTSVYDILSSADKSSYQVDYLSIDKDSQEYHLVETYRRLSALRQAKLIGYAEALDHEE